MRNRSRSERETGDISSRRLERKVEYTRRLRVIEGGRGSGESRCGDSDAPAREKRGVSKEIRRRRRLMVAVLALLAAGLITYLLLGPVMRTIESRRVLSRVEAELAEERARTQTLEDRKSRALTDDFVEEEARKIGYVKPGEIPIIVLDEEEEEQASDPTAANTPNP